MLYKTTSPSNRKQKKDFFFMFNLACTEVDISISEHSSRLAFCGWKWVGDDLEECFGECSVKLSSAEGYFLN